MEELSRHWPITSTPEHRHRPALLSLGRRSTFPPPSSRRSTCLPQFTGVECNIPTVGLQGRFAAGDGQSPSHLYSQPGPTGGGLSLHATRGAIQGCGHTMSHDLVGDRAVWLNLSSLSDKEKADFLDASITLMELYGIFLPLVCHRGRFGTTGKQESSNSWATRSKSREKGLHKGVQTAVHYGTTDVQQSSGVNSEQEISFLLKSNQIQFVTYVICHCHTCSADVIAGVAKCLLSKGAIRVMRVTESHLGFFSRSEKERQLCRFRLLEDIG